MDNNIIALIPARAGSKGLPGKNTKLCAGNPLIQYTFDAARASKNLKRVFVSTDSVQVKQMALASGIEVPFHRPDEISGDDAPIVLAMQHFLRWARAMNIPCSAIMLLQPTSPLRSADSIDRAIDLYLDRKPDTLVSMMKVPHAFVPSSLMRADSKGMLRNLEGAPIQPGLKQKKEVLYARNGPAILIVKSELLEVGSLYSENTLGFEMNPEESIDIDHLYEFEMAEMLLLRRRNG